MIVARLEIKRMPKHCEDCPVCGYLWPNRHTDELVCGINGKKVPAHNGRPSFCALTEIREVPHV